eukprot:Gb_40653 [translate_table: standard]
MDAKLDLFFMTVLFCPLVLGQPGFISINCGGSETYNDSAGIEWMPDDQFIQTGSNETIKDAAFFGAQPRQRVTLRSFPQGVKNCYVLKPVKRGIKYLLRATFVYGNYDYLNSPPTFDLLLDANIWDTISFLNSQVPIKEIIFMANSSSINVCLARSSNQNPINQSMYGSVTENYALLLLERSNFGAPQKDIRYPDDPFDRIWSPSPVDFPAITTEKNVSVGVATDNPPSTVMQTGETSYPNSTSRMDLPDRIIMKNGYLYISMYFAELEELNASSIREFNVYLDSQLLAKVGFDDELHCFKLDGLDPRMLAEGVATSVLCGVYCIVEALADIQRDFGLKYYSAGDPCLPSPYSWEWLVCNKSPSPRITSLNLSNKGLMGTIPASITKLSALVNLDLSDNNMSGSMPEFLANLTNLETLLSGNRFLCQSEESQCSSDDSSTQKGLIIGLAVAGAVALSLVCMIFIICRRWARRKSAGTSPSKNPSMLVHLDAPRCREFSHKEVIEITAGFHRQIGRGGFGPVFHGRLQNGLEVAVKVLSDKSKQGTREFSTEVSLLSRVHHRNVVSFLGYCCEAENQILIYEYMSKGNLRDLLYGSNASAYFLDWETKFDIALNAAQGLEYLHTGCKPRIIHRDVKTANILLGDRMEAKIADFGLSRFWPSTEATHVSTDVRGTFGYLDPEYTITHNLTDKSDVYSFGVVILEILSGRSPIDENISGEQCHIVSWARSLIYQGNIERIIDQKAGKKFNTNAMWKVAELAMACTESQPNDRATMNEVVMGLKEAIGWVKAITNPKDYEIFNHAPGRPNYPSAYDISSVPSPR